MTPADESYLDDAMIERLISGHTDSPELESVVTVVRALREVSTLPVAPSATLRQQMAAGLFTGTPVYAHQPATRGRARRVAAAVAARVGRLRLATRLAAVALAAAVLSTATAGFAGSLPEPVQDRFETVVESVTPYHFAEKTGSDGGRDGRDDGEVGEQPPAEEPPVEEPAQEHPGNGQGNGTANESPGTGTESPGSATESPGTGNETENPGNGNGNGNEDKDKDKDKNKDKDKD